VPFWVTLTADPTAVPPVLQSVGALDCGPNTSNVIVPDGDEPPDKATDTDPADFALPAVPDDGALTDPNDGDAAPTLVSVIDPPHPDSVALLFESPP
jgi:hypothetical protein